MSNFEEKSKQRLIVLKTLYEITDGNEDDYVLLEILQSKFSDLDADSFHNAIGYLDGENLLKRDMLKKGVNITYAGVKEIEDGMKNKDKPTEHFPAINYINIGTMKDSQIQQGNVNSEQTFSKQNFDQIAQILQTLKNSYKDYNLSPDNESDLLLKTRQQWKIYYPNMWRVHWTR